MRNLVRLLLLALVIAGAATPVQASCALIPQPAQAVREAEVAFVGTVMSIANQDRWATVAVEEVWIGSDLPVTVEVRGGPAGNVASSVDRSFVAATRYLFTVSVANGRLHDSICSGTTEWTADLARFRPAGARPALGAQTEPPPPDPLALVVPLLAAASVGGALVGVGAVLRRLAR